MIGIDGGRKPETNSAHAGAAMASKASNERMQRMMIGLFDDISIKPTVENELRSRASNNHKRRSYRWFDDEQVEFIEQSMNQTLPLWSLIPLQYNLKITLSWYNKGNLQSWSINRKTSNMAVLMMLGWRRMFCHFDAILVIIHPMLMTVWVATYNCNMLSTLMHKRPFTCSPSYSWTLSSTTCTTVFMPTSCMVIGFSNERGVSVGETSSY